MPNTIILYRLFSYVPDGSVLGLRCSVRRSRTLCELVLPRTCYAIMGDVIVIGLRLRRVVPIKVGQCSGVCPDTLLVFLFS